MTMPAIAPPERPLLCLAEEGREVDVELGNNGGNVEGVGRWTFAQRPVAFGLIQHESVEFGELDAQ